MHPNYKPKWWHKLPRIIRPPYKYEPITVSGLYQVIIQTIIAYHIILEIVKALI